ncbi:DUF2927 domain-containing protein [Rhodobacteraceae bacterium D3-12]|nr:DUF2927 domain-containing protein [Rhodobacteraceae bacterium D3-12]
MALAGLTRPARFALALLGLAFLPACLETAPTLKPVARPAGLKGPATAPLASQTPSAKRLELTDYYARIQEKLLAQGLMRTDGGGPDTRFGPATLIENFRTVAFTEEYRLGGLSGAGTGSGMLHRWTKPVRYAVRFGASVSADQRSSDSGDITRFAARLARLSGHPISAAPAASANFHVLVMSTDDEAELMALIPRISPRNARSVKSLFRNLSRATHCLVLIQPAAEPEGALESAIVLIRAEHPRLGRQSCIHEEMTQGLGLMKDSRYARPSIFNDDEEFAFLTTHDEMLLKMLYDRRLRPGMSFPEARPIAAQIARELTGTNF